MFVEEDLQTMIEELFGNVLNLQWQQVVMWAIGALLIWLAIKKEMEPSLLLPMGFGAILVNLPMSGAVTQLIDGVEEIGPIDVLFNAGIADGPTAIVVANMFQSNYLGAIVVVAYSYMALVPVVQPFVIRHITTKHERLIRMSYADRPVSKTTRILFPIVIMIVAGLVAPRSVSLIGFLMFGNLIRECGVLDGLSETAQKDLANLITLFLGLTVATKMQAASFLNPQTLLILLLGLVAFTFDTVGGVVVAKVYNLFAKTKINPMIGAAGISAFPMSARVINKMGLEEDNQNFLLMHAVGINVSGQIASVIAGGMIMTLFA